MRRGSGGAAAAVAAVGALLVPGVACTSGGDAEPGPSPVGGQRVLRLATASDVSQGPVRQRLIEAWDEARPKVRVEFVKLPSSADNARSQLVAALQSDSAAYDVVNIDVTWTAEFAAGGLIRPLAEEQLDGMWEQVANTARFDSRTWAVPFNTDAGLLYYRKDIWKDDNWQPPRTWAELERAAAETKMKSQVEQTFPYGYVTQLDQYEGLTVNALESVWESGGELVDSGGEVRAATPQTEGGLRNLVGRYRTIMPAAAGSADERDSLELFRDGEVAFMRNWPYVYNVLSAKGSDVRGDFGVVPLPGQDGPGASVLGGQNLAVTAGSDNADVARELLAYLTEPEQQRCLLDAGFAPVLEESYEPSGPACSLPAAGARRGAGSGSGETGGGDDEPAASGTGGGEEGTAPAPEADGEGAGGGGLPPYTNALRTALAAARPRPVTPYYAAFTELVQTEVHASLNNGTGGGPLAAELDKGLRRVMRGG